MWHALAMIESKEGGRGPRPALACGDALYDLAHLAEACGVAHAPASTQQALHDWDAHAATLRALAASCDVLALAGKIRPLDRDAVRLCVPYIPGRIFGAASNFRDHAAEMGTELAPRSESAPFCFMKAETSVTATDTDVVMPAATDKLDWEVELGVVIGRQCRNVPLERALDVVAGYMVVNDVTARDLNRRGDYPFKHDWFRGKSHDTFGPIGPWLVPAGCIADPQRLRLQLSVNGEMMQDGCTSDMIFPIAEQIAYLSSMLTLKPGDLLMTGTPDGVGMGRGVYLKPGDVMVATAEGIGSIRNTVVAGGPQ